MSRSSTAFAVRSFRSEQPEDETEELRQQLGAAGAQMLVCMKDLRTVLDRERGHTAELEQCNEMLISYARDLRAAVEAERAKARELDQAHLETLKRLFLAARLRHGETVDHLSRVAQYSWVLARKLGLSEDRSRLIFLAAPLHDLGKLGIPDVILNKPGPLTMDEWRLVRQHPQFGADILKGSESALLRLAEAVSLTHHERWDGSGYPKGLSGHEIPIEGHVVMLADQYDALRSRRAYKRELTHSQASHVILSGDDRSKPGHFSPELLKAFRGCQDRFQNIWQVANQSASMDFDPWRSMERGVSTGKRPRNQPAAFSKR